MDLLYTANYLNYSGRVSQGAFIELENLIKENAPEIWNAIPEANWNAVRVNGGIYMIPTTNSNFDGPAMLYREDLRKKYELPEITDMDSMITYLKTIAEKEAEMTPTAEYVHNVGNLGDYFTAWRVLDMKYRWTDWRMPYGLFISYDDPKDIKSYWESDDFRSDMKLMKELADAGVWSRNALASTDDMTELFKNGKTAAILSTFIEEAASFKIDWEENHPDWEIGVFSYDTVKQMALTKHPTQDGFAIPISAKNPERALMLYSKLLLDKRYNNLATYGLEGVHYEINEDGSYKQLTENAWDIRPWAYRNNELAIPTPSNEITYAYYDTFGLKNIAYVNISSSFTEDATAYTAERAALMNVISEFLVPIQAGFVDDVDAAIDEFLHQAQLAGIEKIQQEYTAQWLKYVEENQVTPTKIEY